MISCVCDSVANYLQTLLPMCACRTSRLGAVASTANPDTGTVAHAAYMYSPVRNTGMQVPRARSRFIFGVDSDDDEDMHDEVTGHLERLWYEPRWVVVLA